MTVLLGVDPNLVRPGWTPLVILVLLGIVLFFLGRSMIKQFGKIDVPADHEPVEGQAESDGPGPGEEFTVAESSSTRAMPDLRHPVDGSVDGGQASDRS